MKTTIILTAALLPILSLSSCNTVEGVGKDVQKTGAAIENTVSGKNKKPAAAPVPTTTTSTTALPTTSSTPPE